MYKVIFIIITITISSASCAEPKEAFNQSFITAGELAEQAFFGITDVDMQEKLVVQEKNEYETILAFRDRSFTDLLTRTLDALTEKKSSQQKLPLLVTLAGKLSGYNPPICKKATINYETINTPEYQNKFEETLLPFIASETVSAQEEQEEGAYLTNLIRIEFENHRHKIHQEAYEIIFDPYAETAAIAMLINIFFQAAEKKIALEKKSS
jgi:hypothetical protein